MSRLFAAALLGVLLAAGCASSSSKTFRDDGVSVRYPSDWHATRRALTPVTSPVQVLAVASYGFPRGNAGADGCSPKEALDRLPPNGVFLFGWEYDRPALAGVQRSDFPPRPDHFELKGPTGFECLGPKLRRRLPRGGPAVPDPRRPRPAGRGGRARDGSEGAGQSRSFEPRLKRTHAYAGCDLAAE